MFIFGAISKCYIKIVIKELHKITQRKIFDTFNLINILVLPGIIKHASPTQFNTQLWRYHVIYVASVKYNTM